PARPQPDRPVRQARGDRQHGALSRERREPLDERRPARRRRRDQRQLLLGGGHAMSLAIGVDVGGSGIKVAAVDLETGNLASERIRVLTPVPSTPDAVIKVIARLVKRISVKVGDPAIPVGVGMPCVILDGSTITAANIDKGWIAFPARDAMSKAVGRKVAL